MEDEGLFPGIGIGGYRSFGHEPQFIAPLDRVNVLIGPNNVGKSTVLRAFQQIAPISQTLAGGGQLSNAFDTGSDARNVEGEVSCTFKVIWPVRPPPSAQIDPGVLTRDEWPTSGNVAWLQFENPPNRAEMVVADEFVSSSRVGSTNRSGETSVAG